MTPVFQKTRLYVFRFLFLLFLLYSLVIVALHLIYPDRVGDYFDYYTDSYGVIAGIGGVLGLSFAHKWGGLKSLVGKSLVALSIGLVFQFLGQLSYAYFRYIYNIEVAYPSFGEIFYFGSIPLYILGTWYISLASGIKVRLAKRSQLLLSLLFVSLISIVSLFISFSLFVSYYDFSDPDIVVILLEIGYPLGQAISISFTILAYILSRNILGGQMKNKVILILIALVLQYIADIYYTYDIYTETFYSGGLSDYLYILAYFIMGIGLFKLGGVPDTISRIGHRNNKYES